MDTIECPRCAGKGCVPLADHLELTLLEIQLCPGITVTELMQIIPGVKQSAMCNRVKDLKDLGFIDWKEEAHSTGGVFRRLYATNKGERT